MMKLFDKYCGRLSLMIVLVLFIGGWAVPVSTGINSDGTIYFAGVQIGVLSANGLQIDSIGSGVAPNATDGLFVGANVDVTGTVAADIVNADTIADEAGTGGVTLSKGFCTADGYGGLIGGVAASIPTTNSIQCEKIGVGGAPSAHNGTAKFYPDWDDGNLKIIDLSGATGSIGNDDYPTYVSASGNWRGGSTLNMVVVDATAVKADGYYGAGSHDPAIFTEGIKGPTDGNLLLIPGGPTYGVSMCDYASVERFTVTTNGDPSNGDVLFEITTGDSSTYNYQLDDSQNRLEFLGAMQVTGSLAAANIGALSIASGQTGNVAMTVADSGSVTFSEPTTFNSYIDQLEIAEPATPAANIVRRYVDSTSNDYMAKFDDGDAAVTAVTHP